MPLGALASLALVACKPAPTFPPKTPSAGSAQEQVTGQPDSVVLAPKPSPEKSLLRINSTQQGYNFSLPWKKKNPENKNGLGVLLEGGYILTLGEMVADAAYISFADPEDTRSFPAEVVAVDYEANLALLRPQREQDRAILKDMVPLSIGTPLPLSSTVEMWQLGDQGLPLVTDGKLQNYEMSEMLVPERPFLIYRVKAPMQNEQNSFTLPVIYDGKLAGILSSYDSNNQISQVIESSVIDSFVKDALDGQYKGFPELGIAVSETTDPAFRRYLKLTDDMGGIYVDSVNKSGCAARAGLKKGDVILSIDGHKINGKGSYDSGEYGKLDWTRLINGKHQVGEIARLEIMRDGTVTPLEVSLGARKASSDVVPRYLYDKAPNYIIHGGLVFGELSEPYLDSFGGNRSSAPANLVTAAGNAADYEAKGLRRIVVLNGSIPSSATLGYESVAASIVEEVDGKPIKDLNDLAKALDDKTNDIKTIKLSRPPYKIYVSDTAAKAADEMMKKRVTPQLRRLDS